jgi:hypothetical protein
MGMRRRRRSSNRWWNEVTGGIVVVSTVVGIRLGRDIYLIWLKQVLFSSFQLSTDSSICFVVCSVVATR